MESGRDVMYGGAKYNSSGLPGIGLSNAVDSLYMIKHLCFDTKKCTTRELYDALVNDWKGYEELQRYIKNACPHYGNGIKEVDEIASLITDKYAEIVNSITNPRGQKVVSRNVPCHGKRHVRHDDCSYPRRQEFRCPTCRRHIPCTANGQKRPHGNRGFLRFLGPGQISRRYAFEHEIQPPA